MRIVLNAATTSVTGTLSVAINLYNYLNKLFTESEFFFITCEGVYVKKFVSSKGCVVSIPPKLTKYSKRFFLDNFILPYKIKKLKPDLVINFDNLPVKTKIKQLLIVGNPYYAVDCKDLNFLSYKEKIIACARKKLFLNRLNYADKFIFQSKFMAYGVNRNIRNKIDFDIIPNFYNEKKSDEKHLFVPKKVEGCFYLVYPSYCYKHKNFEILPQLANEIKKRKLNVKLLVTFQGVCKNVYKKIVADGNDDVIYDIGNVNRNKFASLYEEVDGIFFPSYLESFSQILYDALKFHLPIFVSNKLYAKSIFGDSAIYFEPENVFSIVEALEKINDKILLTEKVKKYERILNQMPDNREIAEMYIKLIKNML